jgi:hypothetical protein
LDSGSGVWGPFSKSDFPLDSGSGAQSKSGSSLDSGSGAQSKSYSSLDSDSGLDSGSWFARALGLAGGLRQHLSAGLGLGEERPPPQDKGAVEHQAGTEPHGSRGGQPGGICAYVVQREPTPGAGRPGVNGRATDAQAASASHASCRSGSIGAAGVAAPGTQAGTSHASYSSRRRSWHTEAPR